MEIVRKVLLSTHVTAGCISLILFWLPIIVKKGSLIHIKIGKAYIYSMWIVVFSAIILCFINLYNGLIIMGLFLGFLALITSKPLWNGIAVFKLKKGITENYRNKLLVFQTITVAYSLFLISYGIYLGGEGVAILMFFFGTLGILDLPQLIKSIKTPIEKANLMKEHIGGMCISGIAAYTAFLSFGARDYLSTVFNGPFAVLPWVLPTIIGLIGIKIASKKYA